jgi:hypothetical protein
MLFVEIRPNWQRCLLDDVSFCILRRFQSKHFSEVLERNALRSKRDVLFRPTVRYVLLRKTLGSFRVPFPRVQLKFDTRLGGSDLVYF